MAVIRYLVDKVPPAVEFYTARLGFTLKEDWGPVAVLMRGDLELWLSGPESSAGQTRFGKLIPKPGGANRLVLVVKDLPAMVAQLETAGVRTASETVRGPAGSWVLIADPAGNPIELFEPRA